MKRTAILTLAALLAFSLSANAAVPERKEGNYRFGTQLLMKVSAQVGDTNMNYWANSLPLEYMYSMYEIVKQVNAARTARGITEMVDVTRYPISPGMENAVEGGYEYDINFNQMSPEDVEVVLAAFPLTGAFSDAQLRVQPINTGYYYANSTDGENLSLSLPGGSLSLSYAMSGAQIEALVAETVLALFGVEAAYDFSWSVYKPQSGLRSLSANLTVYLDPSQVPVYPGEPYHGE